MYLFTNSWENRPQIIKFNKVIRLLLGNVIAAPSSVWLLTEIERFVSPKAGKSYFNPPKKLVQCPIL